MGHHYDGKRKKTKPLETNTQFEELLYKPCKLTLLFDNLEDSYESGKFYKFIEFAYTSHP